MQLKIQVAWIKKLDKSHGKLHQSVIDETRWKNDNDLVPISIEKLTDNQRDGLHKMAMSDQTAKGANGILQKMSIYKKLSSDPTGANTIPTTLESLVLIFKKYISKSKNKWLFQIGEDNREITPYYVEKVTYYPADPRNGSKAHTSIRLLASSRHTRTKDSITFSSIDLMKKRTAVQLLNDAGFYLETEEMAEEYEKQMSLYNEIRTLTGKQFNATGYGLASNKYYSGDYISLVRDGEPTKVIIDDHKDKEDDEDWDHKRGKRELGSTAFWQNIDEDDDNEEINNSDAVQEVIVPIHPYICTFDLAKHQHITTHVTNLEPYKYDTTLIDKLILPQDKKDLINILIQGSNVLLDDIIKGKTGGVIVLATGDPGTGKSLTAEVFSETIQKPLYVVQCSQLGTDEESLEKELSLVLSRASRWKAILLIDEADVYIHERGDDIQQNAIVGVFLRILEYYKGILFMTSNRETIIDDAIMSRATAWIRYVKPNNDELSKIWEVLSKQYKIEFNKEDIKELIKLLPGISGRNVKNLLKLSHLLANHKKEKVTPELVKYVSNFLDINHEERKAPK